MDNGVSLADIAAVTDRNNNGGWGNNGMFGMEWIFALLILPALWGGNGGIFGNRGGGGNPVTEADLCQSQSFSELKGAVGRLNDQVTGVNTNLGNAICNLGYETLGNFKTLESQLSSCCCQMERLVLESRYLAQQDASETRAHITAQTQRILDYLCNQDNQRLRDENLRNYIQQQFCGVVRYPNQTTYNAGVNPFFNSGCGCNYNNGFNVA